MQEITHRKPSIWTVMNLLGYGFQIVSLTLSYQWQRQPLFTWVRELKVLPLPSYTAIGGHWAAWYGKSVIYTIKLKGTSLCLQHPLRPPAVKWEQQYIILSTFIYLSLFSPQLFPVLSVFQCWAKSHWYLLRSSFPQPWTRTGSKPPHTTAAGFTALWQATSPVLWCPVASFLHSLYETGLVLPCSELWHASWSIIKASRLLCWSYLFMPL